MGRQRLDNFLYPPFPHARLEYAARSYEEVLLAALGESAVNEKKRQQEGDWAQRVIVWGILFDLSNVAQQGVKGAVLSLPPSKLQKADMIMSRHCFDQGNREVRQLDVQKLCGNVLFWSVVVYPLRMVLPPLRALTAGGAQVWARPKRETPPNRPKRGRNTMKRLSSRASLYSSETGGASPSRATWRSRSQQPKCSTCLGDENTSGSAGTQVGARHRRATSWQRSTTMQGRGVRST